MSKNGITLTPVTNSPKFETAKLSLKGIKAGQNLKVGKNTFDFGVENYELGNQTPDGRAKNVCQLQKRTTHSFHIEQYAI